MVSLSYAIGVPEPLEVFLYTYCTGGGASPDQMEKNIRETWPLDIEFPWEKRDPRSLFTREEGYYA